MPATTPPSGTTTWPARSTPPAVTMRCFRTCADQQGAGPAGKRDLRQRPTAIGSPFAVPMTYSWDWPNDDRAAAARALAVAELRRAEHGPQPGSPGIHLVDHRAGDGDQEPSPVRAALPRAVAASPAALPGPGSPGAAAVQGPVGSALWVSSHGS